MKMLSKGREEAFSVLFRRHFQRVFSFFYRSTGKEETSKDLAQEVFLKVFKASKTYEERAKFTTWLFTISRNTLLNFFRDRGKDKNILEGVVDDQTFYDMALKSTPSTVPDPLEVLEAREIEKFVESAMEELPESFKTPFILSQVNGLSYQEISEILELSQNAVKIRVFRAREQLMEKLKNRYFHET